jgi:hypothetical protein
MQKDMGAMMGDMSMMISTAGDASMKARMHKMHDQMASMMANMQKMRSGGSAMMGGAMHRGPGTGVTPSTPPLKPQSPVRHRPAS